MLFDLADEIRIPLERYCKYLRRVISKALSSGFLRWFGLISSLYLHVSKHTYSNA